MLGTGGRQTKPDRKGNRLCLSALPPWPHHTILFPFIYAYVRK